MMDEDYIDLRVSPARIGDRSLSGYWQDAGGGWEVMFLATDPYGIVHIRRKGEEGEGNEGQR